MRRHNNLNLYFYGLKAWAVKLFGIGIIIYSLIESTQHTGNAFLFCVLLTFVGIGIFFYGNALRFDFKRKSGSIIHAGDGWR